MSTEISIKQLPQITEINNDDLLLVQKPNATNTLLFSNFVIGLENTTFSSTITQNSTDIETLSTELNTLSSSFATDINTLSSDIQTLSSDLQPIISSNNTISSFFGEDEILDKQYGGTGLSGVEYVEAYINADQSLNTGQDLTNYTKELDTCGCFNTSTGIYTVKDSGYKRIFVSLLPTSSSPYDMDVVIKREGSGIARAKSFSGGGTYLSPGVVEVIRNFNAGDEIKITACASINVCGSSNSEDSPSRITIQTLAT